MRRLRLRQQDDRGIAMLTVVMVGAIMTALGVAITQTTIVNLDNAGRDRVASGALGAAEAGVAGAISYMRDNGVNSFCDTCSERFNTSRPETIDYVGGGRAVVTVKVLQPYNPPSVKAGRYLIRSTGTSGAGPGKRTIEQIVAVTPFAFPLGVYSQAKVNLGGQVAIAQESLFSGACIDSRSKLRFIAGPSGSIVDPYNDIPAGAHSISYITDRNQGGAAGCATNLSSVTDTIHSGTTCSTAYPTDQTGLGGPFTAADSACITASQGKGDYPTKGSKFDLDTLRETYGFVPRGLTDEQFAILKAKAKANGTYFKGATAPVFPVASSIPGTPGYNPVIYLEDQNLSLTTQLNGYGWTSDPSCTLRHPSVILVVERGSVSMGSSSRLTGHLFVPDGSVDFSGGADLTGTIFAGEVKFTGGGSNATGNIGLNDCYARNTHGGLFEITKERFRQVDAVTP